MADGASPARRIKVADTRNGSLFSGNRVQPGFHLEVEYADAGEMRLALEFAGAVVRLREIEVPANDAALEVGEQAGGEEIEVW